MAFNGSGTFSLAAGNPVVTGTTISSTWANNTLSDIATGLSTVICKDGQTSVTANLPMAGFKHTGVAVAAATTDYARYDQVQNSAPQVLASVAGTNTITGSASPTPAAYVAGQVFRFIPAGDNTSATTLNVSSLGAGAVQWNGVACVGGEIRSGIPVEVFVSTTTPIFNIIGNDFNAPFLDTHPIVYGGTDRTKKVRVEVDGLTTATTRVWTAADRDLTVGGVTGTAVASTSGTSIDFTSIPSGTKRITVTFASVSTNGTSNLLVRIGDTNGVSATGYVGAGTITNGAGGGGAANFTTGFGIASGAAAAVIHGTVTLTLADPATNAWVAAVMTARSDAAFSMVGAGSKALAAVLDRVSITTVNGTDAFDAGAINIMYE
jgi:hypothetical protein